MRCFVLPCRICRSVLYLSRPAFTFSAWSTSFCVFLVSSLAWANSELNAWEVKEILVCEERQGAMLFKESFKYLNVSHSQHLGICLHISVAVKTNPTDYDKSRITGFDVITTHYTPDLPAVVAWPSDSSGLRWHVPLHYGGPDRIRPHWRALHWPPHGSRHAHHVRSLCGCPALQSQHSCVLALLFPGPPGLKGPAG